MAGSTSNRTGEHKPVTDKGHDVESQRRGGDTPKPVAPDPTENIEDRTVGQTGGAEEVRQYPSRRRRRGK